MLSTHSVLVAPVFCLAPPLLQRACLSSHAPRVSRPRVNYFVKWPEVVDLGFIYVWCFCYTCFTKLFLRWNMFCLKQLCLCWVRSSLADFVVFIKTLPVYYFVYQSNVWKQLNLNNGTVGQIIQGTHLNYLLCCALLGQVCWGRYVLPCDHVDPLPRDRLLSRATCCCLQVLHRHWLQDPGAVTVVSLHWVFGLVAFPSFSCFTISFSTWTNFICEHWQSFYRFYLLWSLSWCVDSVL